MNIAEASPKGLEHFWQKLQMRGDRKSDRQMTHGVAAQLFSFLLGPAHVVEDCRGPPDEGLTQRRRYHAFGASLEQWGADFALQFGQAASEARLRSAELTGSRAQAAALGDGHGATEMAEFHAGLAGSPNRRS